MNKPLRYDLEIIASWIPEGASVLGLGCGQGDLLYYLKNEKAVQERGIEISESNVACCIGKGLSVLQGDINEEMDDYPDHTFDYAICSQTLQQVYNPPALLKSMLRIAKKGIVSFPNFGHWSVRMRLMFSGMAPVTDQLPYAWHDTPNIRALSISDFERFAEHQGYRILKKAAINAENKKKKGSETRFLPNLFAASGVFLLGRP